jgi:hypothetical protein
MAAMGTLRCDKWPIRHRYVDGGAHERDLCSFRGGQLDRAQAETLCGIQAVMRDDVRDPLHRPKWQNAQSQSGIGLCAGCDRHRRQSCQ